MRATRPVVLIGGFVLAAAVLLYCAAYTATAQAAGGEAGGGEQAVEEPTLPDLDEPLTIEGAIRELKAKFRAGGKTMWAILFLSIVAVAFVLERLFRLRRGRISPAGMAAQATGYWRAGQLDDLEALCERRGGATLTKIIQFGLRHPKASMDEISTVAGDIASRDRDREMMFIYPLGVVAALAPLLGLFGTVVGMIESFEIVAIAGSMGDPSMLSASISKALVTTAFGLLVAMPALFAYQIFRLWTNAHFRRLEEDANGLIVEWFMGERRQAAPAAAGAPAETAPTPDASDGAADAR